MTVTHRFEHPCPYTVRLFVCEAHAVSHPDPRPLTDNDRAELQRRRKSIYRQRSGIDDTLTVRTNSDRNQGRRRP